MQREDRYVVIERPAANRRKNTATDLHGGALQDRGEYPVLTEHDFAVVERAGWMVDLGPGDGW